MAPGGPSGRAIIAPDWVIVGATMDDGRVVLVASDNLGRATLTPVVAHLREQFRMDPRGRLEPLPTEGMTLEILMGTYTMVMGTDYADALRRLFDHWSPDRRGDRALTRPMLPLDPPPNT